jgi:pyrroline-5-carboxylate reductase
MGGPVALVGCGKMGGALLGGWLDRGMAPAGIEVIEPGVGLAAEIAGRHGVTVHSSADELAAGFSPAVVLFAVKPQAIDEVAPAYRAFAGAGTVFLTIAAGKTVASFEGHLGETAAVVRAMPNTPAAVRRGIAVAFANANVSDAQRDECQALLEAVGEVAWVDDEGLLDPVTAVSGSGPAYVFLLIECLAEAGIAAGLPSDLSSQLARATVAGSGELARLSEEPAGTLRQNVTSPGGTTAAALEVLMGPGGLKPLMARAVEAATRRSRELAS